MCDVRSPTSTPVGQSHPPCEPTPNTVLLTEPPFRRVTSPSHGGLLLDSSTCIKYLPYPSDGRNSPLRAEGPSWAQLHIVDTIRERGTPAEHRDSSAGSAQSGDGRSGQVAPTPEIVVEREVGSACLLRPWPAWPAHP